MERTRILDVVVLILALGAEVLAVWLLPRWGVIDPTSGVLAGGLGAALIGALVVQAVRPRRA